MSSRLRPTPPAASSAHRAIRRRNLPLLFLQAREGVIAQFRPLLNEAGVTEQQWRIVRALLEHGPMEPRQIVEVCRISSPSLAGVLARMEELGLIARERLDHDARRLKVSLTPKSRGLAQRLAPRIEAAYRSIEQRLGAEFIERLHDTLDAVIAALGEGPGEEDEARPASSRRRARSR